MAVVVMGDWMAGTLAAPVLDLDPLAVALPPAEVAWAGTVNLVAAAALLAVAGRLADLAGRRGVLAVGLALYVLGASAVIVAPSWPVLVGARLGQGAGVGLMVPAALAMLLAALPERRRAGGVALWTVACGAGVLGMQAGSGWLLAMFGWRGLFLPGAAVAAVLLLFAPALPRSLGNPVRGSAVRPILLAAGIAAAVLTLARGGVWGWTSGATLGCAAAAALLLAATLILRPSLRSTPTDDSPRGDGRHRAGGAPVTAAGSRAGLGWAVVASGVCGAAFFALLSAAPAYVAATMPPSADAGSAGVVLHGHATGGEGWHRAGTPGWLWLVPVVAALAVAAPLAARAARRFGANGVVLGGAVALGSGCALLLARPYPLPWILAGALLAGAGLGALTTGALTIGAAATGRANLAAGVAAVDTARLVGAAAGIAGATVLTTSGVPGPAAEGSDAVLLACLAVAVLLTAATAWRWAAARRHRTVRASLRAAQQEAESLRGLLLELRASFTEVRGQADRELVRLGIKDVPAPWGNPHGQE
ncbi:MFS transporter [Nonomuraea sp. NPDC048826]|uniref:MFS transporter n=1 Tax=Nonomuraea sp. NPDC048826 TaxID=3364347 RepID=UPI0037162C4A